jgi:hypothetical protein
MGAALMWKLLETVDVHGAIMFYGLPAISKLKLSQNNSESKKLKCQYCASSAKMTRSRDLQMKTQLKNSNLPF